LIVVGASTSNILPLLTAGAAETLGLSGRQVGILSLMINIGFAASSFWLACGCARFAGSTPLVARLAGCSWRMCRQCCHETTTCS